MQTIINGHKINFEYINQHLLDKEIPVLIFLHEGLGSIKQWKDFPQELCDSVSMPGIVYDRYGYGFSDSLNETRKTSFLHDEGLIYLPELIKNLKIKNKIILVGHSDGATIALIYASAFSETLLGVVSEAAHVILEDISFESIRKIRDEYKLNESFRKKLSKYHPYKTDTMFYGWTDAWLSPLFKDWNMLEDLGKIRVPVLAIQGDKDEYGTYEQLATIKNNVKAKTEILYIPNCGHTPHIEEKNKVLSEIKQFIFKIS